MYSKKSKYFKIISFFSLPRKQPGGGGGAKDFAGRIASYFGSVVATSSREPILQIGTIFSASKMAARAFSRYCKAHWSKLTYQI